MKLALFLMAASASLAQAQPTITITLTDGVASFAIENGGNAVKADAAGNIDIYAATQIRFALAGATGITFEQISGRIDRAGARNFPKRVVDAGGLTLDAANLENTAFEYSITYKRTDGSLGVIDPHIINHSTN